MVVLLVTVFLLGYAAIVFEHPIHINKTASALLTGVILWSILAMMMPGEEFFSSKLFVDFKSLMEHTGEIATGDHSSFHEFYHHYVGHALGHHLSDIAQIVFFLLGAMTIVELVDAHGGFRIITDRIKTRNKRQLIWIISIVAFFLSAVLDNLTTTIVMITLLRKLIKDREERLFFASMVVIAANAGGAWTPIGDVTTTMLWIGGQVSAGNIMKMLFLSSLITILVPLAVLSFILKGEVTPPDAVEGDDAKVDASANIMFFAGVGGLIFVPIFKTITHLPPYLGMMLSLGIVWVISELMHHDKDEEEKKKFSVGHALSKIDTASVLFFLGILLAISALQSLNLLNQLADSLDKVVPSKDLIVYLIGLTSAIIDNVPLVAASMGMYDIATYPMDHKIWEFMAYCAGTGGSVLIIGSAAGVAAMGMEKIDFIWYLRKISLLALLGYSAGALAYLVQYALTHAH